MSGFATLVLMAEEALNIVFDPVRIRVALEIKTPPFMHQVSMFAR
jgi:hypothetical protein